MKSGEIAKELFCANCAFYNKCDNETCFVYKQAVEIERQATLKAQMEADTIDAQAEKDEEILEEIIGYLRYQAMNWVEVKDVRWEWINCLKRLSNKKQK